MLVAFRNKIIASLRKDWLLTVKGKIRRASDAFHVLSVANDVLAE